MVEIRELTPDDWRLWRQLRLASLAEAPHAFGARLEDWQGDGDREERWRSRLDLAGSHNVVAMLDDRAVGMASGVPTGEDGVVELISMWVAPPARGRGVGDALVEEIERWAWSAGARAVRLSVAEDNDAALALYQRHGFTRLSEADSLMPDGVRREWAMQKHPVRAD